MYQDKQIVYKNSIHHIEKFQVKITRPPKADHKNKVRFSMAGGMAAEASLYTKEDGYRGQQFDFYIKGDYEADAFIRGICEYGASLGICKML